jgi:hypothetical protein
MVTTLLNAPPTGGTVTPIATAPPSATVNGVAGAVTVYAALIVSVSAVDVEAPNSVLPEYAAVMLPTPLGREEMLKVATPAELTVPVPSRVVALKKLTVPRDEPVGAGEIVAVKVTDCPAGAGLGDPVSVIVVDVVPPLTVSITAVDVEVAKPELP